MRHTPKTKRAAERLRQRTTVTDRDMKILTAAGSLRKVRGPLRKNYSSEEVELMARGRAIAFNRGQLRLARFLTLRTHRRKKRALETGKSLHECPACGHVHREPHWRVSRRVIETEAREIRRATREAK